MNDLSWNNSSVGVSCDMLDMDGNSVCKLQGQCWGDTAYLGLVERIFITTQNYRFVSLPLA